MNENKSSFPAKGNPYTILTVPNLATPSQIKKSFRKLSLKYHPDKRESNLTKEQHDKLDQHFISVQEARDFLLGNDFKNQKEQFDTKLRSETLRKVEEDRRDKAMSSNRKRMRQDLESKIHNLKKGAGADANDDENENDNDGQGFQDLKRDGMRRRHEFGERTRTAEEKLAARAKKKQKNLLENRQVRIKWSRKKMGGQSDEMIANLMKRFGSVEEVELIGNKGNSALVTFLVVASCKPCVDAYLHSDEMRASHIGKRKGEEDGVPIPETGSLNRDKDRESVQERKLRQAAEREILLRKMELGEEDFEDESDPHESKQMKNDRVPPKKSSPLSLFPPSFPVCEPFANRSHPSPLERLELLEKELLRGLLSSQEIKDMQIQ
eukprot:scaffold2917_cov282-Chaetoceros_neogracile.AAC.28